MPSFVRTFGTDNLDKSTDSIPGDVLPELQDREAEAQPEQPSPDTNHSPAEYLKLDLKVCSCDPTVFTALQCSVGGVALTRPACTLSAPCRVRRLQWHPVQSWQKFRGWFQNYSTVQVEFRAVMPCVDIRSMGVLSRVVLRTHLFNAMEAGWASRPNVRVSEDPRAWWQHALQMVLRECRKVRRRRMTLLAASRKRKLRQKYQMLYRRIHQGSVHYTDPDRRCDPAVSKAPCSNGALRPDYQLSGATRSLMAGVCLRFDWHPSARWILQIGLLSSTYTAVRHHQLCAGGGEFGSSGRDASPVSG